MRNMFMANPAASFVQGQQYATQADEMKRQRGYNKMMAEHGAGIAAGDQNALAAYAQYDPMAVYGMRRQQRADDRAEETFRMKVAEYKRGLSAAEAAAQAEQIKTAVKVASGAQNDAEWDALVTQYGATDLVGQFGNREALLRGYMTVAELLEADAPPKPGFDIPDGYQLADPQRPHLGVRPILGYEKERETSKDVGGRLRYKDDGSFVFPDAEPDKEGFRVATPDEAAQYGAKAGQIDTKTGRFYPINPPKGMSIIADGKGGFTFTEGPGVPGQGNSPTVGDVYDPGEVQGTLDLIDEILNDKSLSRVTGPLQGGGGNDVENFGAIKRAYYGAEGLSVIQKINQLQSRSWLAARAMLKGGGPITDYESRKAEAAVARLSRAQGDAEFVAALKDLQSAIKDGLAKLQGAPTTESGSSSQAGTQYQFETDAQRQLFEKYRVPIE